MKKIYAFLAAAFMGVSAYAAIPTQPLSNVSLDAQAVKALSKVDMTRAEIKDNGIDRAMKITANGKEWATIISMQGAWTDMFQLTNDDGTEVTLEDFPFYAVIYALQERASDGDFVQLWINWPGYGATDNDCWSDTGQFDAEKAKAKYGDLALTPMSYEDFRTATGEEPLFTVNGLYQFPCIYGAEAMGAQNYKGNTIGGVDTYPVSGNYVQGSGWNIANATTWDWQAYDEATSDVSIDLQYKYNTTVGGAMAGAVGYQLNGSGVVLGYGDITFDTIGEVHIFNGGRQADGDEWTWNYELTMEKPLNFYYLALCDETMGYMAYDKETGENLTCYTDTELPIGLNTKYYGAPNYAFSADAHITYVAGAIWAAEGAEPYGMWTMAQPKVNDKGDAYEQGPAAYNLVVRDKSACGFQDGFYAMYEAYTQTALPGKTFLGIGDKRYGLNFALASGMTNGHYILGSYTGDIIYHGTPGKWLEYTQLPSITANGDYNALNAANSAVESVESDAPVVSTSYYNFQGQRLSSEPENGMYIIRAVKADGTVKATKVAK